MAKLAVTTLLLLLAISGAAAAQCPEQAAADCCRQIAQTVIELKYEPGCIKADHKPLQQFVPCADPCFDAPCHQPVVTFFPCGEACPPDACHKPATPTHICSNCPAEIELTGCRCEAEQLECAEDCAASCDCT